MATNENPARLPSGTRLGFVWRVSFCGSLVRVVGEGSSVAPGPRLPLLVPLRQTRAAPKLNTRYLKAVWLEIFGPVFQGFPAESDPRDPPTSPRPAPHIHLHEKSAPQTNSKATW